MARYTLKILFCHFTKLCMKGLISCLMNRLKLLSVVFVFLHMFFCLVILHHCRPVVISPKILKCLLVLSFRCSVVALVIWGLSRHLPNYNVHNYIIFCFSCKASPNDSVNCVSLWKNCISLFFTHFGNENFSLLRNWILYGESEHGDQCYQWWIL